MTLQRFLIENYGPNVDAFKMALAEAIKFSRLNGISQITLVISAKGGFPGTIIGEFMASDHGLAHRMLKAGSLYDVSLVLACAAWMIALVLLLNAITRLFERSRLPIVQFLSVSPGLWTKRPLTLPEG